MNASPRTWEEAFDDVVLDPKLRKNFQFWMFAYPTGLPFPYAASLLRNALVETVGMLDPDGSNLLLHQMMLVGHSMGGLLVRVQVGDSGTAMWDQAFSKSPQEIELPPEDIELLEEVLIFESLPFVTRAVFFSAPHRGSKQAANVLGKVGASLVNLPDDLKEIGQRIRQMAHDALTDEDKGKRKISDSVQALQPESRFIKGLDQIDVSSNVTYHTIVGDKGQGDTPDSSDGFVPYWSSHLDGAASEIIVPSEHSTHHLPEGI